MTVISWNCRGLGQPRTVQELVCLVRTYRPSLVFISETRKSEEYVNKLRRRLGLKHCISHVGKGKGAGIALFYDEQVEIKKLAVGPRYIDVLIRLSPHSQQWRGTFVYGEPNASERHHMWDLLRRIRPNSNEPWLMMGDFNETAWQHEHFSRSKRNERNMANFREVLSDCNLVDLGFKGPRWTYDNKQEGLDNVKARLDRGVADPEWNSLFPEATVEHICTSRSDHLLLLLRFGRRKEWRPVRNSFRYEYMWERMESLTDAIVKSWGENGTAESLSEVSKKISTLQSSLNRWAKRNFGSIIKQTAALRKQLEHLWAQQVTAERDREIKAVAKKLDEVLHREEMMWRQRSRALWLREGDKNTRYFQRKATWRRNKNTISKLKDEGGSWIEERSKLQEMTTSFFKQLYTKEDDVDPKTIVDNLNVRVTNDINTALVKEFTEKEISDALFQIGPLKAPGSDGFPARFFQRNWGTVKKDVVNAVLNFFKDGIMPEGVNDTVIVLIPKGNNPEYLKDFRPISLCNVIYKVISKCLVNRLRPFLEDLISETQSAFIPGD